MEAATSHQPFKIEKQNESPSPDKFKMQSLVKTFNIQVKAAKLHHREQNNNDNEHHETTLDNQKMKKILIAKNEARKIAQYKTEKRDYLKKGI